jgi:hypothetical protein
MDFRNLHGEVAKLRPKQHFLVHFPTIIMKNGPLAAMSCLRYEMKNSFFKRSSGVVCNFVNICKTLAYRHQCNSFYLRLCKQYNRSTCFVGHRQSENRPAADYAFCNAVCDKLGISSTENINVAIKVELASVTYRKGYCFVTGFDGSGRPQFGEAVAYVSCDGEVWFAVVEKLQTCNYECHFHAFKVKKENTNNFSCFAFDDLKDYHPLFSYSRLFDGDHKFIRLKYHVISV